MSSKVAIANRAIKFLGGSTITSFGDGTETALTVNLMFDNCAKFVMALAPWTSVVRRASLARTTNTPVFDYTYEFQLPVDPKCLKVIDTYTDIQCPGYDDYAIEDDKLLYDDSTCKIKYIAYIEDSESWDIYLENAIEAYLKYQLCLSLTGDKELQTRLQKEFTALITEAKASNNQQGSVDRFGTQYLADDNLSI